MSGKIFKLSSSVINQIAAGEVVENPASIVKELIENSLDAGATSIEVTLVGGGHELIRIEDNGSGMSPEDALLSLERHATSKIRSVEDLETLSTMGFRGEALAAISSVSQLELKTSDGKATRILAEAGSIVCVEPCARNRGTTIEVRSLFYNVPARKKFQKSKSASLAAVTKAVEGIALAHPEIAFSLNGRRFAACSHQERIEEILGVHEHPVEANGVFGFVASPEKAMAMRTGQYLYINRRPIFSPLIAKAVKEAFGTRINEHSYPRFVLFLEMAPDQIDVNVHPQKKEVRFQDEGAIFRKVQKAIEETLSLKVTFSAPLSFSAPSPASFSERFLPFECKMQETQLEWVTPDVPLAVFGRFFLLQRKNLLLVDLKAAHARLLYESLTFDKAKTQALMWPIEIPIGAEEEERAIALQEIGVECRILKKSLVVDALPSWLEVADFPQFYKEWKGGKKMEEIATYFCRSLSKTFSLDQAVAIWREVQKCQGALYDPLGNPISKEVSEEDLAYLLTRAVKG
jgi:DNA mismatch repair protein MutL